MKKFISILMVILLFVSLIPLNTLAVSYGYEGFFNYSITDGEAKLEICDYSISGDIIIPDTLGGCPVTAIGSYAFRDRDVTSVVIPNSVTSIGDWAFGDCENLKSVTIPDSVTTIGGSAFNNSKNLENITVDSNNTAYCSEGDVLFNKDKTILMQYPLGKADESYSIPNSVTRIDWGAFKSAKNLKSITFPNGLTTLADEAFAACTKLESITIPDSVTSIGKRAFMGCESVASLTIGNKITNIDDVTFSGCKSLTTVTIPNSVTRIGMNAFNGCDSLAIITIPESVTFIETYALGNCSALTNINVDNNNTTYSSQDGVLFKKDKTTLLKYPEGKTEKAYSIPESVTTIEYGSFENCTYLESLTIPESVLDIAMDTFLNFTNLKAVRFYSRWQKNQYGDKFPEHVKFTILCKNEHTYISDSDLNCANCMYVKEKPVLVKTTLAKVKNVKIKVGKKKATISWKKAKNAKKYVVKYSYKKNMKGAKTKTTKKLKLTIKKLKSGKKVYVQVQGINGKTKGKWSAKKVSKKIR